MAQDPGDFYESDDDYAAFLAAEGEAIWENDDEDVYFPSTPPPMRHVLDDFIFADDSIPQDLFFPVATPMQFVDFESDKKEKEPPQQPPQPSAAPTTDPTTNTLNANLWESSNRVRLSSEITLPDLPHEHQSNEPQLAALTNQDIERTQSPPIPVRPSPRTNMSDNYELDDKKSIADELASDFRPGADPVLVTVDMSDLRDANFPVRPSQIDAEQAELAAMLIQMELYELDLEDSDNPALVDRPGGMGLELHPIGYADMTVRTSSARLKLPNDSDDDEKKE